MGSSVRWSLRTAGLLAVATLGLGCGGGQSPKPYPPAPQEGALRITLTGVAWTHQADGSWLRSGAVVDLQCDPPTMRVTAEGAAPREGTPDAVSLCAHVASEPDLLRGGGSAAGCQFWGSSVTLAGTIAGRRVAARSGSCRPVDPAHPADVTQRWLSLLGMRAVGPDPPAA